MHAWSSREKKRAEEILEEIVAGDFTKIIKYIH